MENRRTFIKKAGLSAFSAGLLVPGESPMALKGPVVLSTWRFGLMANEAAWKVLSAGGHALDAVEAGVRVVESDPEERSVGIGGRPDRDGRVTLDACIMDENLNIGSVACLENIENPVSVARAVLDHTPHVMLVGQGAFDFAITSSMTSFLLRFARSPSSTPSPPKCGSSSPSTKSAWPWRPG
jgi:N4-(beta-N-acetylglucosaminyl)-L-asparaginase